MDSGAPITRNELTQLLDSQAMRITQQVTQQLKDYIDERTQQLKDYIDERNQELKEYVDERTHDAETRLLRGFADYSDTAGIRFRKLEADVSNIDTSATQRLGLLEKQVTDLHARIIALEGAA